jgi:alpha-glucosidase (family GH31 glycosyl hydrolase)
MLGDNILVASIVEKNARKLNEVFSKGNWKGDDSKNVKGGKTPD